MLQNAHIVMGSNTHGGHTENGARSWRGAALGSPGGILERIVLLHLHEIHDCRSILPNSDINVIKLLDLAVLIGPLLLVEHSDNGHSGLQQSDGHQGPVCVEQVQWGE